MNNTRVTIPQLVEAVAELERKVGALQERASHIDQRVSAIVSVAAREALDEVLTKLADAVRRAR